MNLLHFFNRKPEPQPLRAIVATRSESLAAQRRRASKTLELAVYVATTTYRQRKRETDAYWAVASAVAAVERAVR